MNLLLYLEPFPNDSGPIYQETLAGRLPVEPFNTFSNIFFLMIILYFSFKVYANYSKHRFLAWSLPVLFLGFIGGTVYHATRSHDIWMFMDWLPIIILCLSVSLYYIFQLHISKLAKVIFTLTVLFLVLGVQFVPLPQHENTSIGYVATAIGILLPIVTYLISNKSIFWSYVLLAFLSFGVAITFRVLDNIIYILPMGTHWLWHTFGALSVFFLMNFIYRDRLGVSTVSSEKRLAD